MRTTRTVQNPLPPVATTWRAPLCFGLLAFATAGPVLAGPHPVMSDFQPEGGYVLAVDGNRDDDVDIYLSRRAAAYLIVSDALPSPVLVWAGSKRVDTITKESLLARADGGIDLDAATKRTYLGNFDQDQLALLLPVPDHEVRFGPKAPLTGRRQLAELLEHTPGYRKGMAGRTPDKGSLERLSELAGIEVRVFFGSWCGVCRNSLPFALRLDEELADEAVRFEYYGLDTPPQGWDDPEVKRLEIKGLPTAIVYRDGKEVGRFAGGLEFSAPEKSLLEALGIE